MQAIRFETQGTLVQIGTSPAREKKSYAKRGAVNHYSSKSRVRNLKSFARMDFDKSKSVFITVTYPATFPHAREAKAHLRAFIKRVNAYAKRNHVCHWKLEFQSRGAPHFHLIFVDLPFVPKERIQQFWSEIIGYEKPFTRIAFCKGKKKVLRYLAKYIAKTQKDTPFFSGFNIVPYSAAALEMLFIHIMVLMVVLDTTADMNLDFLSIGRFWGIEHRSLIKWSQLVKYLLIGDFKILWTFKRYARRFYSRINKLCDVGCFIFTDNAARWEALFREIMFELGGIQELHIVIDGHIANDSRKNLRANQNITRLQYFPPAKASR